VLRGALETIRTSDTRFRNCGAGTEADRSERTMREAFSQVDSRFADTSGNAQKAETDSDVDRMWTASGQSDTPAERF
ncbi:MAG: hypothetical protein WCJ13_07965, partial [Coriobacteriia bacterium]